MNKNYFLILASVIALNFGITNLFIRNVEKNIEKEISHAISQLEIESHELICPQFFDEEDN